MTKSVSRQNWKGRLDSGTWEVSRRTVSVAGRVTDVQTGRSINGVHVKIASGSTKFSFRTKVDGHFHFLDLPNGRYTLTALLPGSGLRYETAQVEATVFHDVKGNIKELRNGDVVSSETGDLIIKLEP